MNMPNILGLDLFQWWAVCITGGSVFLTLVSLYLYTDSRPKRKSMDSQKKSLLKFGTEFIFVWILLGLLLFYIISIQIGSSLIFAVGNLFVEALLLIYLLSNRKKLEKT